MSRFAVVLSVSMCGVGLAHANLHEPETHFLAVKLNGKFVTKDTQESDYLLDVVALNDEHYLSVADLTDIIGITPAHVAGEYHFDTPIGMAILPKDSLSVFEGKDHVRLSELKRLGIHASYSQSELAVVLNMGYKAKKPKITPKIIPITHKPQALGVMNAHADFDLSQRDTRHSTHSQLATNLGAFGYGMGGVWGVDMRHHVSADDKIDGLTPNQNNSTYLNNAYWATSNKHWATRFGVNQSSFGMRGVGEYTGATLAYSSQGIERHLSAGDTHTKSLLLGQHSDLQTIKGTGTAGGVAELRVEGRAVSRVLIGLDGRYEFLNLDVSRLDVQTMLVEVALYDYPQAGQPTKVERIFVGKRRSRSATGEWLMEAGVGRAGNWFDDALQNSHTKDRLSSDIYGEYGLSNRVALKAGLGMVYDDHDDPKSHHYLGMNLTPAKYTNVDLGYWHLPNQESFQGDVRYERHNFSANYALEHHRQSHQKTQRHSLYGHYRPTDALTLNFSHHEHHHQGGTQKDYRQTHLSMDATLSPQLTAGAYWYSLDDRYGYRVHWHDKTNTNRLGVSGDHHSTQLSLWHQLKSDDTLGFAISHKHGLPLLYQAFINHQRTDHQVFNAGVSVHRGQVGVQGAWQYRPRQGVSVSVGYQQRHISGLGGDDTWQDLWQDKHYFYAKVRFDFYKTHKQPLRVGSQSAEQQGGVVVNLLHPEGLLLEDNNIRFNLSAINTDTPYQRTVSASLLGQRATNSQYLIKNLPSGDYQLSMDARHLPFEYMTDNLPKPTLRVDRYAPTQVDFVLQKTYGITGRLSDGRADVAVELWQNNQKITQITSDEWGDFQTFDLPNGAYEVRAEGYRPKQIQIEGDVLMNVALEPME